MDYLNKFRELIPIVKPIVTTLVSCQHGIVVSIKAPSYELRGLLAHSS